ncbi:MAG: HRDC domain-containing protein [Bifidobacteriaceae bacterium]|jgi:ribonuclease D|nr:HRDC domain-containing protein [Bifidobacteriaceae bacterium]
MTESVIPLDAPPTGVPPLTDTPQALARAIQALAKGHGPVAADSERASGFRYRARAELVQLFRRGSGLILIDARALPDLSSVSEALAGVEWVFHAASQDLPCLRECGIEPDSVFDTELASRLLGEPRVGLAAVVARTLGLGLAKEHSAQDWSRRPLPKAWLNYAALDVAILLDVRDVLERELDEAGKLGIARAEAAAVLAAPPPASRVEPWRRTSGRHALKDRRQLAVVRSLWQARDRLAAQRDIFPGRVLPDSAIVAAATALPRSAQDLGAIPPFNGRRQVRLLGYWWTAVSKALSLPPESLPPLRGPSRESVPPVRHWSRRHPAAAQRIAQVKTDLAALSESEHIPVENLMQPDLVRSIVFAAPAAPAEVSQAMAAGGARDWQIDAVAPVVVAAIADHPEPGEPPVSAQV